MSKFHAKVYKNIADFRPKVLLGMTGRQLCLVAPLAVVLCSWSLLGVAVDPANIGWVATWWPGVRSVPAGLAGWPLSDWGQFVVIAVVIGVAVLGWAHPMGMKPETVIVAAIRHYQRPNRLLIKIGEGHEPVLEHQTSSGRRLSEARGKSWSRPLVHTRRHEGPGPSDQGDAEPVEVSGAA